MIPVLKTFTYLNLMTPYHDSKDNKLINLHWKNGTAKPESPIL